MTQKCQKISLNKQNDAVVYYAGGQYFNEGFNASEIRLTGNVVGEAPFYGTLVHKGWRAAKVSLPKITKGHHSEILAPAEVEL